VILGSKVLLRAINLGDASQILKWSNDPEIKYLVGTIYPVSDVEHEIWMENKLNEKTNKIFAIEEEEDNRFIGIVGCRETDFINRNTEIYIYLGEKDYWGKGYGSDAIKTFIDFCFNQLNLHKVNLTVFEYNVRAIKAYEKIGFLEEGRLKENIYKSGKYYDKILMGIINNK
jgi:RimJ/RimL family protein N-acetyltransferase